MRASRRGLLATPPQPPKPLKPPMPHVLNTWATACALLKDTPKPQMLTACAKAVESVKHVDLTKGRRGTGNVVKRYH